MRADDLLKRLEDQPFKPFHIHLSDGTVIPINNPGMVIVGATTAILPTRFQRSDEGRQFAASWQTVSLLHIVRFSDSGKNGNGRRKGA